jgi:hypothetical protein
MAVDASSAADVQSKAKIFISYSRRDMAFVDRIEPALRARGFEPLIDRAKIYAFGGSVKAAAGADRTRRYLPCSGDSFPCYRTANSLFLCAGNPARSPRLAGVFQQSSDIEPRRFR